MIEIYTDGSCKGWTKTRGQKVGKCFGGWAYIILGTSDVVQVPISGSEEKTTSNRMELKAVLNALIHLGSQTTSEVTVFSDSAYLVNAFLNDWVTKWKNNYWRIGTNKALQNKDLWIPLIYVAGQFKNLRFEHVKGHSGNPWNEKVDELAQAAAKDLQEKLQPDLMETKNRVRRQNRRKDYPFALLKRKDLRRKD